MLWWLGLGLVVSTLPGGVEHVAQLRAGGLTVSDERVKSDVSLADPGECLEKISRIELRHFTYRSKQFYNRMFSPRQLGVVAQQARSVMPDAVAVVPQMRISSSPSVAHNASSPHAIALQSADRLPAQLDDFHVVDASVLFMHNVGATQRLNQLVHKLTSDVDGLSGTGGALRTLESSLENLRASQLNESTAQVQERRRIAEANAKEVVARIDIERIKAEERRASAKHEIERDARLAEMNTKVAMLRVEEEDKSERLRNADLVALQEQSSERQEATRVANEVELLAKKHAFELKKLEGERVTEIEKEKIAAEARIKQERDNEDIAMRRAAKAQEAARARSIEQIKTSFELAGKAAVAFLSSPRQMATVGGSIALLIGTMILLREVAKVLANQLAVVLGRPSLIRQSSRAGLMGTLASIPRGIAALLRVLLCALLCCRCRRTKEDPLKGIVLEAGLQERIGSISTSVRNARRNRAPLRHFLFYGPPGTGKTLVARRLANVCGLDYAIMSGGDVIPLGKDAVTELHSLFGWASRSRKGLLLFIDEADAFLASRNTKRGQSDDLRNAITALLYHTGSPTTNLMLVLASNRPGDLDAAVADRIDEAIEFDLPGPAAREKLVRLYFEKHLVAHSSRAAGGKGRCASGARIVLDADIDEAVLSDIATRTENFSGREISKLWLAVQSHVYGSSVCGLNKAQLEVLMVRILDEQKKKWQLLADKVAWS